MFLALPSDAVIWIMFFYIFPLFFQELVQILLIKHSGIGDDRGIFFFFLLLAVLTELFLRNTQFGRNLFLVGGNISVADNLVVMMTRQFSASGNLALQGPMEVIPMVIVGGTSMAGGRGGALKTVGGVVLLKIIYNAMTMFSIPAPLQPFVKGLILLVVIVSDKYMERRHEKV